MVLNVYWFVFDDSKPKRTPRFHLDLQLHVINNKTWEHRLSSCDLLDSLWCVFTFCFLFQMKCKEVGWRGGGTIHIKVKVTTSSDANLNANVLIIRLRLGPRIAWTIQKYLEISFIWCDTDMICLSVLVFLLSILNQCILLFENDFFHVISILLWFIKQGLTRVTICSLWILF